MNESTTVWTIVFVFFIAIPLLFGYVTMRLAAGKGRDSSGEKTGWFLLGFFFTLISLIVALVIGEKAKPAAATSPPPPPPAG